MIAIMHLLAGETDRHTYTHMQILSFVLHWKTSFTLEHSAALHTAVDTWHEATDSCAECCCRCHSSSCQAERLLALQVYFGRRSVFLMYFYPCLRWVGVIQFMCVHKKGSRMLEKEIHYYAVAQHRQIVYIQYRGITTLKYCNPFVILYRFSFFNDSRICHCVLTFLQLGGTVAVCI